MTKLFLEVVPSLRPVLGLVLVIGAVWWWTRRRPPGPHDLEPISKEWLSSKERHQSSDP